MTEAPGNTHEKPKEEPSKDHGGGGGGGGRHPFIQGLLKELPSEGTDWAMPERVKWLKAAAMIFDLIYKNGDALQALKIEALNDSAK